MSLRIGKVLLVLVAVALMGVAPATVKAEVEIGDICFNFAPFIDTMRCNTKFATESGGFFLPMDCRIRAAGSYQLVVTGSLTQNLPPATNFHLGLTGVHGSTAFGGNQTCVWNAFLGSNLSGPFTVECPGAAADFNNSGTLNLVACTAAMDEGAASGRAMGQ